MNENIKNCKLYLGNYGYPMVDDHSCEPPELPKWAFDFIDEKLKSAITTDKLMWWGRYRIGNIIETIQDPWFETPPEATIKFILSELLEIHKKLGREK